MILLVAAISVIDRWFAAGRQIFANVNCGTSRHWRFLNRNRRLLVFLGYVTVWAFWLFLFLVRGGSSFLDWQGSTRTWVW